MLRKVSTCTCTVFGVNCKVNMCYIVSLLTDPLEFINMLFKYALDMEPFVSIR